MAILSIDGFESGVFSDTAATDMQYFTIAGSPSSTTTVRSGTGARAVVLPAGARLRSNAPGISGLSQATISLATYITAWPTAGTNLAESTTGGGAMRIRVDNLGQLYGQLYVGGIEYSTSAFSASLNTWYWIDFRFDVSTSTYSAEIKIDGGTPASVTTSGTASTTTAFSVLNDGTGGSWIVDDWIIADYSHYPLGPHKVLGLHPNADGTNINPGSFRDPGGTVISAGNPAYVDLNTIPFGTANYIEQFLVGSGSYIEINFDDVTETADAVGTRFTLGYFSAATQANRGLIKFSSDSFTNVSEPGAATANTTWDMSVTALESVSEFYATPIEGSTWTPTKINGIKSRFGYSADVSPIPRYAGLLVEAAYAIPAATTPGPATLKSMRMRSADRFLVRR